MDRLRSYFGPVAPLVVLAISACAQEPSDDGSASLGSASAATTISDATSSDESSSGEPGLPTTPDACFQEHLANRGSNCDVDYCGGILSCYNPYPDCFTCSQQCFPPSCSTDAECQQQFGDLCPGVNWICDAYLLGTGCTVDFGDSSDASTSVGDESSSGYTTTAGGCAAGDPFECSGDDLYDCATGDLYDCVSECIAAGFSGTASPPCGLGNDGYEVCLCL